MILRVTFASGPIAWSTSRPDRRLTRSLARFVSPKPVKRRGPTNGSPVADRTTEASARKEKSQFLCAQPFVIRGDRPV